MRLVFSVLVTSWFVLEAFARKNKYIVPGATWYDTNGEILSAHAGGIVEANGTWYWFGQNERVDHHELFAGNYDMNASTCEIRLTTPRIECVFLF